MNAAAILGADWRQKVLDKDLGIMDAYQQGYADLQSQLTNNINPILEQANADLEVYEKQIDALKEQKQSYSDMQDAQKNYLEFFKQYADQYATATDKQKKAWDDLSKAIATFNSVTGFDSIHAYYDSAMSEWDDDYVSDGSKNTLPKEQKKTVADKIVDDLNKVKTAFSNSSKVLDDTVDKIHKTADALGVGKPMFTGFLDKIAGYTDSSQKVYDAVNGSAGIMNQASTNFQNAVDGFNDAYFKSISNKDNHAYTDNRSQDIIINNPGFELTFEKFMNLLNPAFAKIYQDSKVGK